MNRRSMAALFGFVALLVVVVAAGTSVLLRDASGDRPALPATRPTWIAGDQWVYRGTTIEQSDFAADLSNNYTLTVRVVRGLQCGRVCAYQVETTVAMEGGSTDVQTQEIDEQSLERTAGTGLGNPPIPFDLEPGKAGAIEGNRYVVGKLGHRPSAGSFHWTLPIQYIDLATTVDYGPNVGYVTSVTRTTTEGGVTVVETIQLQSWTWELRTTA